MRYLLGVFGFVLLAFIVVVILLSRIPSSSPTAEKTGPGKVKMVSFANKSAAVSLTTVGPLVGDTERRAVRVSVTPNERRVEVLAGYDQQVISSNTYPNTEAGYESFLSAMDVAGFTESKKPSITDQKGVCPLGRQYVYDVTEDGNHTVHLWGTSCASAEGTFAGRAETIQRLFRAQIPDYSDQTAGVKL